MVNFIAQTNILCDVAVCTIFCRDYLTRVDSTLFITSTNHVVCGVPVQIVGAVTFVYVHNG